MNPRLGGLAVMNGDIDFTTTFGTTLRGILQGLPIKVIAISVRRTDHFLIARPEIKTLQDLRDKRLGVSTLFGTDQLAAEDMMTSKGFNPSPCLRWWLSAMHRCGRKLSAAVWWKR